MKAALLVVAALALALIAWLTWTNATAPARLKVQFVRSGLNADDAARLVQLRARGFNLTKPADLVFFLDIPAVYDARAAASELRRKGYAVDVVVLADNLGRSPSGSYKYYFGARYSLIARICDAPTVANIKNARNLYSTLARRYNGKYYGWLAHAPGDPLKRAARRSEMLGPDLRRECPQQRDVFRGAVVLLIVDRDKQKFLNQRGTMSGTNSLLPQSPLRHPPSGQFVARQMSRLDSPTGGYREASPRNIVRNGGQSSTWANNPSRNLEQRLRKTRPVRREPLVCSGARAGDRRTGSQPVAQRSARTRRRDVRARLGRFRR